MVNNNLCTLPVAGLVRW